MTQKKSRSIVEYYFTLSPVLPHYILSKYSEEKSITYLDSDTYLFNSPEVIFNEIENASVSIVEHRFPKRLQHLERHGKYNVGWLTFKNNDKGRKCLEWYTEKCLEWCYDIVEERRFADQKYLDYFKDVIDDIHEIKNIGCNLAPWNIGNYTLSMSKDSTVFVDDVPLVLYHYEGLKRLEGNRYISGFHIYKTEMVQEVKEWIYEPYLKELAGYQKIATDFNNKLEMKSIRLSNRNKNNNGYQQLKKNSR